MGKARVTPSLKDVDKLRRSTPRTELRGLLLLCRMVTSSLYGLSEMPAQITLCGDSECTISAVECEDGVLQVWFSNRVAEVLEHMEAWRKKGIVVDKLQHWPGLSNIADIGTKGKAGASFNNASFGSAGWCTATWKLPSSCMPSSFVAVGGGHFVLRQSLSVLDERPPK